MTITHERSIYSMNLFHGKMRGEWLLTVWLLCFVCVALVTDADLPWNEMIVMSFGVVVVANYRPAARILLNPFLRRVTYLAIVSILIFFAYKVWLRLHFSHHQSLGPMIWLYQYGYALTAFSLFRRSLGREPELVIFSDKPGMFPDRMYAFASVMLGWVLPNMLFPKIVTL